jgi:hypothetical protein
MWQVRLLHGRVWYAPASAGEDGAAVVVGPGDTVELGTDRVCAGAVGQQFDGMQEADRSPADDQDSRHRPSEAVLTSPSLSRTSRERRRGNRGRMLR